MSYISNHWTSTRGILFSVVACLSVSIAFQFGCNSETEGFDFATGEFTVTTNAVDDQCIDGGLNLLFMPRGEDEPWEWPHAVELYSPSELDATYSITLREPFGEMTVTATQVSSAQQELVAHPNPEVLLGAERFGDCVAELDGVVELNLLDSNSAEGVALLEFRDPRGDERCPADMPDTCNVSLSFDAQRVGD